MKVVIALASLLAVFSFVRLARADDEMVRVKGGSFYRGEIIEKVVGDHLVVKIATGSLRNIAWNDVIRAPYDPPESPPPTFETIRTKDGSLYHGELLERVVQDHVAVKLANGAVRVVLWKDLDETAAPAPPTEAPIEEETVRLVDGSSYRGEVLERVVSDHVTIRIRTGAIREIVWANLDLAPVEPRRRVPDVETIHTQGGDMFHGEVMERVVTKRIVLRLAGGDLKSIAWDELAFPARMRPFEDWSVEHDCRAELAQYKSLEREKPDAKPVKRYPSGALASGVLIGISTPFVIVGMVLLAAGLPIAAAALTAGFALAGGGIGGAIMSAR